MNKSRLEAFSDGVLAIIITIMVLEIKMPHQSSITALQPMLPTFFCYALSFVFVGIYWGNHHHLLHVVKHVSSGIMWANLNLLFWLSLVPFATGWMGENNFATSTVACYAVLLNICGVSYTILQHTIMACHSLSPNILSALKKQTRKGIYSLIGYTSAIGASFITPVISEILFVIVAIMWIIPDKNIERAIND